MSSQKKKPAKKRRPAADGREARRRKLLLAPPHLPAPASVSTKWTQWAVSLALVALFFFIPFHPLVRMARLLGGQEDYRKLKVTFQVDGVPAQWGYSGFAGPNNHLQENETTLPLLNHNYQGGPLLINGQTYPEGIGVHSPSQLAFATDGKFRRFSCQVGLDEMGRPSRGIVFYLLADGKEIFRSPKIRYGQDPYSVDVSIAGARQLVLGTEVGDLEDVWGAGDWVNLKFEP